MKKKYIPALIGIPILFYLIISGLINNNKIEKSIKENKFETIGKVSKFYSNRSFNHYYFIYYYKNKKYTEVNDISSFGRETCIGKYYKINLSTKNPEYSKIFLDQEVTDSTEIVNAGFKYK
jgi:hypothetical protein